jgi:hypothetical protein
MENSKIDYFQKHGVVVDTLDYRGFTLEFYEDLSGRQLVTIWKGLLFEFGRDNMSYRDDAKLLIDDHLDTISRFEDKPEFWGAKLQYFQNGSFSDIRLIFKGRILKVYCCSSNSRSADTERAVIEDALFVLSNYVGRINC